MQRTEQLAEKTRTSQAVRASLNSAKKDLENASALYRGVNEDETKAKKAIAKLEADLAYFRKNKLEHQARGLETGQLHKKHQALRDAERLSKELPDRIQALEKEVAKHDQELETVLSVEKAKIDASKAKAGSKVSKPGDKQQSPISPRVTAGTKRQAANESEPPAKRTKTDTSNGYVCDPPTGLPPSPRKDRAANPGRGVQAGSRKESRSTDDTLKPKAAGISKPGSPKKPTTFRRRQIAKKEAIKATARQLRKEAKAAQQSSSNTQQDCAAGNNSKGAKGASSSKNKKRSAPVDEDPVDKSAKRQKLDDQTRPRGLINHSNACFANAVIQLLDKALEGHDLDAMIGRADDVETFGLTDTDIKEFDNVKTIGMKSKGLEQKETELRSAIKAAARASEVEKLSAGKHLRKVIDELHEPREGLHDAAVSPYMLQQVVAWGAEEDADNENWFKSSRQKLSGDTQEDCFEYFKLLLNDLTNDINAADSSKLKELFKVEMETTLHCPDDNCGFSKEVPKAEHTYHMVHVPDAKALKARAGQNSKKAASSPSLSSLIDDSLEDITDVWCEGKKCGGVLNEKRHLSKVPDNLVVSINRMSFRNGSRKISTKIELDEVFEMQGSQYALKAVINHKGPRLNTGHYTAYREQQGKWYCLDDSMCIAEAPQDGGKRGNAVMALYKNVKA